MSQTTRHSAARSKAASARPRGEASTAVRLLTRVYQPAYLFPLALALGTLITWPYLPRWAPDLSNDPAYQLTPERLDLPKRHAWIPAALADRVLRRAQQVGEDGTTNRAEGEARPLSLLDPQLAARVAAGLAADPWVAEVRRVQVGRDGIVAADVEWRMPALMVSTPRGMYAVDRQGVLLPPEDFRAEDVARFPIARGVTALPQVGAGQVWNDPLLLGAVRLALFLAPRIDSTDPWQKLGLQTIELPLPAARTNGGTDGSGSSFGRPRALGSGGSDGGSVSAGGGSGGAGGGLGSAAAEQRGGGAATYELRTRGGSLIVWGRPPGTDSVEPPAEQKLSRLLYYLEQCGSFESSLGPSRIDIRGVDAIYAGALRTPPR